MTTSHEKRLLKLLTQREYVLVDVNGFGTRLYQRPDCRDVLLYASVSQSAARDFTRQVEADTRPPRVLSEWDVEQAAIRAHEKAEAEIATKQADQRLGGLAKYLTEPEIDDIEWLTKRRMNERRRLAYELSQRPFQNTSQ